MLINGLDAKATWGFTISAAPGWADAPSRNTPNAPILRRGGARVLDTPRDQAKQITMTGNIRGTSTQDARDKADALKLALMAPAGVKLIFDDFSTRYIMARVESFRVPPFGAHMIGRDLNVEIAFTAHDPYFYDNALTTVAGNTQPLPQGTGPSRPIITVVGAAGGPVNPVFTLKNNAGATVATFGLTVTLIAGDTLIIDCDAKTIKLNGVNRIDLVTTGDFFLIDPADPQFQTPYATITIAPATGTSISTSYRKSWR